MGGGQRTQRHKLSPERRTRLEAVDGWVWDVLDAAWEEGFTHLEQYVAMKGHARVPGAYTTPDGYKLGGWVKTQRSKKKKLSPQRRKRLEALNDWVRKAR